MSASNLMNAENLPAKDRLSQEALSFNSHLLTSARAVASIAAGLAAGILGVTGLSGIIMYIMSMLLLSAFMHMRIVAKTEHVAPSTSWVWTEGMLSAFASYILVWTLAYDYVHVY